jgi:plasmid stabilization system protein ParE
MARVSWHRAARADVERLYDFLWVKSPKAAEHAAQTILEGVRLLETSPQLGRPAQDATERRELVLPFGSSAYIVSYMLQDAETVIILQVYNSREKRTN